MKQRPTIKELEEILNSPEQPDICIMSDGSISTETRFRLVQDDSCHWYAIPAKKRQAFEKWVLCASQEVFDGPYEPYEGEAFDDYRLNMSPSNYTFVDLKEDH
jgi:hypothetical protein